jgi:hypothetical protein
MRLKRLPFALAPLIICCGCHAELPSGPSAFGGVWTGKMEVRTCVDLMIPLLCAHNDFGQVGSRSTVRLTITPSGTVAHVEIVIDSGTSGQMTGGADVGVPASMLAFRSDLTLIDTHGGPGIVVGSIDWTSTLDAKNSMTGSSTVVRDVNRLHGAQITYGTRATQVP